MEACGGLEYWEITFVCANTVTFLCRTKDLRSYNETRNKWQNQELTVKAWNNIQVFLLNEGFHRLCSILETPSFNHITSRINSQALTKLTMNQKFTKKPATNNSSNKDNYNISDVNVKNTKSKKESSTSLVNEVGLHASSDEINNDENQKMCKNESQMELEHIAFGKMAAKNENNATKKMDNKSHQHKERSVNPKNGPVMLLQASSKTSNRILSSNKKIEMFKTTLADKKIEPQAQEDKSKADKKKEKKQRQKEKKKEVVDNTEEDDVRIEIENERSNESLQILDQVQNNQIKKDKKKLLLRKELDDLDKPEEEDSMVDEIDFNDEEMPAFIKSVFQKSGKKLANKSTKKDKEKASNIANHNSDEDNLKTIIMALKTDKACLDKACEATMKGKWKLVVACFTKAIELRPSNMGHYLNRCFYHLRTNSYSLALNDALYVIQKTDNVYQEALAKFRAGQISYAMKNFDEAERYMLDSVRLFPDNLTFLRELFYIRIKQLVTMGFPWKAAVQVFHKTDSFAEACNELSQGKIIVEHESPLIPVTVDSEIYFSDDENDFDSVESLTNLTLEHSNKHKKSADENHDNLYLSSSSNTPRKQVDSSNNVLKEQNIKALPKIKDPIINYKDYEDKVLFIGNLTSSVTSTQIKKKFSCYGKILSIIQPPGMNYAFVNFENPISLKDVLTKESDCKINDIKLTVRPKPKKR